MPRIGGVIKKKVSEASPKRLLPEQALRSVTSKSGLGVYASSDTLFKDAVFGRDSLEVAEDLLYTKPKLVKNIILTIASLQGENRHSANEEEPGKIIHEYRTTTIDGKPIDRVSLQIFDRLSQEWGGSSTVMAYYGSIDSTPLFIRLLIRYVQKYGPGILLERVKLRSGELVSVLEVLDRAVQWTLDKLSESKCGLLEYVRINPHGIKNQAWKDSDEFYMHANGRHANHEKPIASIEVQALAYDALVLTAELLPSWSKLKPVAARLQKNTVKLLWMEKEQYFALGFDHSAHNRRRVLKVSTANPAEMLNSRFFLDMEETDRQKYVGAITMHIMSSDFLTDAGIRSRSLSEANLVHHWDYHGSFVSWPKETYDIANGLRLHGFPRLANELFNRILNITHASRSYPEFVYVDRQGRVLGTGLVSSHHGEIILVEAQNRPERIQAWTVSAALGILARDKMPKPDAASEWQKKLESQILKSIPHVNLLKSKKELNARYPSYPYELKGGLTR